MFSLLCFGLLIFAFSRSLLWSLFMDSTPMSLRISFLSRFLLLYYSVVLRLLSPIESGELSKRLGQTYRHLLLHLLLISGFMS